jgi:hypothetical protein
MSRGKPRVKSASLFVPADERRTRRKSRRKAERSIQTAAATEAARARRATREQDKNERRAAEQIPAGGERRPAALRSYRRLHVPPHRSTTAATAAAFPFQAEYGLGSEGSLIGEDAFSGSAFFFDPWVLYNRQLPDYSNPNIVLAGVIGAGKSSLAKSLVTRSLEFGRRAYVPGDPKGEWTPVAEVAGGLAYRLGPGQLTRINPLDPGPRPRDLDDDAWTNEVRARRLALLRGLAEAIDGGDRLVSQERSALAAALDATRDRTSQPLLPMVVHDLLDPDPNRSLPAGFASVDELRASGRKAGHALNQLVAGELAGLFDRPSTAVFDPAAPMVTIDLSRLGEDNPLMPLAMACTSSWMEAALRDPSGGHRWLIYDEAWRVMREVSLLRRMQSQWKLSRAWGIANLAIVHRLTDFSAVGGIGDEARQLALGLMADCSTRIIYRQETDQLDHTATALGLTRTERDHLPKLSTAQGLWRVGRRSFLVNHTWCTREAAVFRTDAAMQDATSAGGEAVAR